jgi:hypothetical protein
MELVYLWVEDYKNIKKQGFNFSPRFECKYDENSNELTIEDKSKDYVSIFPDNINVTAIVGENGSGKSSVLVGITNHKAIFKIGNEYFSRGFDLEKINFSLEIKKNDKDILKHVVYVDFDFIKFPSMKDIGDYESLNIYDRNLYKSVENSTAGDINFSIPNFIHNFYNLLMEHKASFESKLFFFNPHKIIFNDYLHEAHASHPNSIIVNELLKQVSQHPFSKKRFHFIITSHYPFILSDLPKKNVIFLDKVDNETAKKYPKLDIKDLEDGNCINVSSEMKDFNTFGANIHTLLSHGFFMSNGLMGEFAKSKIEEIKKFYVLVKKCEKIITKSENVKNTIKNIYQGYEPNFVNIQNIIGEPFLKTIIGNYLDELEQIFDNDTYKNKKRDNLLKQFSPKELEEYLESLKHAKN